MTEISKEDNETLKRNEKIAADIGRLYRACRLLADPGQAAVRAKGEYAREARIIYFVERCLFECCGNTQNIIRREFLEIPAENWYVRDYTRNTYVHLRERALAEFVNCLGI